MLDVWIVSAALCVFVYTFRHSCRESTWSVTQLLAHRHFFLFNKLPNWSSEVMGLVYIANTQGHPLSALKVTPLSGVRILYIASTTFAVSDFCVILGIVWW